MVSLQGLFLRTAVRAVCLMLAATRRRIRPACQLLRCANHRQMCARLHRTDHDRLHAQCSRDHPLRQAHQPRGRKLRVLAHQAELLHHAEAHPLVLPRREHRGPAHREGDRTRAQRLQHPHHISGGRLAPRVVSNDTWIPPWPRQWRRFARRARTSESESCSGCPLGSDGQHCKAASRRYSPP